jgi:hypothetical protein
MNIPPDITGRMNASVVAVMAEAGRAINDTFRHNNAGKAPAASGVCGAGVISVVPSGPFDYIVSQEDLQVCYRPTYTIEDLQVYYRPRTTTYTIHVLYMYAILATFATLATLATLAIPYSLHSSYCTPLMD